MKKKFLVLLLIITAVFSLLFSLTGCTPRQSGKERNIVPKANKIHHISIAKNQTPESSSLLNDKNSIAEFVNIITTSTEKTRKESVNDQPANVAQYYIIRFHGAESEFISDIMFLYSSNGCYYIEQPYSGIWKMPRSDFEKCISYYSMHNSD